MRAQILTAFNTPYQLLQVPEPKEPQGHDVLVRVLAASYCHTDAIFASGTMQQGLPRVGCHEFAGEIVQLGPLVSPSLNLAKGGLVGIPGRAYQPCGTCNECTENEGDPLGYGVRCTKALNLGFTKDGGFQDYALADSRQVAPIPSALTPADVAPLMCAGTTIWSALRKAGISLTEGSGKKKCVAISGGGGGLGHLGIQFAAYLGCDVVAIDAADRPLQLARSVRDQLGDVSNITVADARVSPVKELKREIFGPSEAGLEGEKGADVLLVLPEAQSALDYGIELLKNHGVAVIVSFPDGGFVFNPRDLVFRDIKVVGTLVGRNHEAQSMLKFAAEHNIRASTKLYSLEQLNELVDDYHGGAGGKLVIDMTKSV